MRKYVLLSALNLSLFFLFLYIATPAWILFLTLSLHYCLKIFNTRKIAFQEEYRTVNKINYGTLGYYQPDNQDTCFGLYIKLLGAPVFIDIKEDAFFDERKHRALELFKHTDALEKSLLLFISKNKDFNDRKINSIGLHSKNIEQGEVFWDPTGYTQLQAFTFV